MASYCTPYCLTRNPDRTFVTRKSEEAADGRQKKTNTPKETKEGRKKKHKKKNKTQTASGGQRDLETARPSVDDGALDDSTLLQPHGNSVKKKTQFHPPRNPVEPHLG